MISRSAILPVLGRKFRTQLLVCCALLNVGFTAAINESGEVTEHEIKAALVFKFIKFVEWPEDSSNGSAPFVIGVLGKGPMVEALQELDRRAVQGRMCRIEKLNAIEQARDCHLIFVADFHKDSLKNIFSAIRDRPVLTIGDGQDFTRQGGMIMLYRADNKVRFEINLRAVEAAGLRISSKVLNLARITR